MATEAIAVPRPQICAVRENAEPSLQFLLALGVASYALFVACVCYFEPYSVKVISFGDSAGYMAVASAIRRWNFAGLAIKQFWGLPYTMAVLSHLMGLSDYAALLIVSGVSSFASLALAHRLWGGWVAAFFALLSFDWMQRSFLGGAEPLFVALLFGAFVACRQERWLWAALFAAMATTVRPLGFLALVAIGATLLWRREYRKCALATGIGLAAGMAYVIPLWRIFGDPLATVHSYVRDANGLPLFGIPFRAIVSGFLPPGVPWTNLVLSVLWLGFVLGGVALLLLRIDQHSPIPMPEVVFAALYLAAICCYNCDEFARSSFARFAIPIIPFSTMGWSFWIPKSRWLLVVLAGVSPVLAAASAVGVIAVFHRIV